MPSNKLYQDTNHKIRNNFNTIIDNRNFNRLKEQKEVILNPIELTTNNYQIVETDWQICDVTLYHDNYYYTAKYNQILNLTDYLLPHIRVICVVNNNDFLFKMSTNFFIQQTINTDETDNVKVLCISTQSSAHNSSVELKVKFIVRVPLLM